MIFLSYLFLFLGSGVIIFLKGKSSLSFLLKKKKSGALSLKSRWFPRNDAAFYQETRRVVYRKSRRETDAVGRAKFKLPYLH